MEQYIRVAVSVDIAPDRMRCLDLVGNNTRCQAYTREQVASIERIQRESADRIQRLEAAMANSRSALRAAEEAVVFDEAMAGNLIRQQAEIAALKADRAEIDGFWARTIETDSSPSARTAWKAIEARRENLARAVNSRKPTQKPQDGRNVHQGCYPSQDTQNARPAHAPAGETSD